MLIGIFSFCDFLKKIGVICCLQFANMLLIRCILYWACFVQEFIISIISGAAYIIFLFCLIVFVNFQLLPNSIMLNIHNVLFFHIPNFHANKLPLCLTPSRI